MSEPILPDLDITLVDLVLGLLRAPRLYPELICSDLADDRMTIPATSVQVTLHYVAGLLAYGFDHNHPALKKALNWFMVGFPNEANSRINTVEMARLEALLLLNAPPQYIVPRIKQLEQQRILGSKYFLIDQEANRGNHDMLWVLRVMRLAEQRNLLNGRFKENHIPRLAERILNEVSQDKDRAMALYLGCPSPNGNLPKEYTQNLSQFIMAAKQTGGLWGDLDEDTRDIVQGIRDKNLSIGDHPSRYHIFRNLIVSTCGVIENLAPFAKEYPELQATLQEAITLWWDIFRGDESIKKLHILFPEPVDYLTVLARTLVALRAYLDKPLISWGTDRVYEILAAQESDQIEHPQLASIHQALRRWVGLGLSEQPERLRLGMSGTNILRVKPRIWNPMYRDVDEEVSIPHASSLVIKSGPLYEIQQERKNYSLLPSNIQPCFARVPEPSFVDEKGVAYLILQDLHHYRTLDEILRRSTETHKTLQAELGPFLMSIHGANTPLKPDHSNSMSMLWLLYLLPMQTHIERIFAYIQNTDLLIGNRKANEVRVLKEVLLASMGDLLQHQQALEKFPTAHMHGDLHSRNIMVRKRKLKPHQVDIAQRDYELDFKLIDLEKMHLNGDAALDGGELLADLKLTAKKHMKEDIKRQAIEEFIQTMNEAYLAFGEERDDLTFPIRLQLGEARSLLRVAKGRTKAGQLALDESRWTHAQNIAEEILDYARTTVEHLQDVLDLLKQMGSPPVDKNKRNGKASD